MRDALTTKYYINSDGDIKKFSVCRDEEPLNPRKDWDGNVCNLYLWWNRYSLGDNEGKKNPQEVLDELVQKYVGETDTDDMSNNQMMLLLQSKAKDKLVLLPCFIYEHGGLTISCSSFNDRWDSGCAGFIVCTKDKCDEVGADFSRAREWCEGEIKDYDMYLRGECYGYEDEDGDSCWGFYSEKWGDDLFNEIAFEAGHKDTKFYEENEIEEKIVTIIERKLIAI